MTNVTSQKRLRWGVRLTALAVIGVSPSFADPRPPTNWGLPQLMASMREVRSARAQFSEQKFDRLLKQSLQSSGILTYVAPDQLEKATLAPVPSRMIVKGDRLTVGQPDGKTRDLSLSEYPAIGALVASIRATLAGDAATLTRYYIMTMEGDAAAWSLRLEPRDDRLRAYLASIRIRGEGNTIRAIATQERDGDRTEMSIAPEPQ